MDDPDNIYMGAGAAVGFIAALYISAGWELGERLGFIAAYVFGGALPCAFAGLILGTFIQTFNK